MRCHHLVLPSPSLCSALPTCCFLRKATPKWMRGSGEAQNPGPAEHEGDITQKKNRPRPTRINEAGDAGSQDSITRGVQNIQLADVPAAQPIPQSEPRNSRRPTQQRPRHQRPFIQCGQCGADPHAYTGHADSGLIGHMCQKHGGQPLAQESVAQLRQLGRGACVILLHHVVAAREPLQSLQGRHRNPRNNRG